MNEFDVKRRLAQRSEKVNNDSASRMTNGIPNSVLADVFAGKQKASSEMMGHRSNLAPSIAAKMSQSFGMDVSGVQIYRSDAMVGSTMHGMAQGNKVVLSSDVDLNTLEGQAVLGHELSHVRAQGMGIGTGNGLLSDAGLEHQADTEGMLAARGMNISGESMGMSMGLGMAGLEGLSPIGAGLGVAAAAPMQADKDDEKQAALEKKAKQGTLTEKEQSKLKDLRKSRLDVKSSYDPISSDKKTVKKWDKKKKAYVEKEVPRTRDDFRKAAKDYAKSIKKNQKKAAKDAEDHKDMFIDIPRFENKYSGKDTKKDIRRARRAGAFSINHKIEGVDNGYAATLRRARADEIQAEDDLYRYSSYIEDLLADNEENMEDIGHNDLL